MEKLYNSILLEDGFNQKPSDASDVPYLKHPPEIIDVSVGRQLFVDNFLIDSTDLVPEYHKAVKYAGNPVLKAETQWEKVDSNVACPKSGGVWYDEKDKLFKMWYEAGWLRQMCYAESTDGIHFQRPDLGLERGTNKILLYDHFEMDKLCGNIDYLRPDSTTVVPDYTALPQERYKLFLRNPGVDYPGIVATSPDGIHFENFTYTSPLYDRSTIFYNPFRKKWVYSIRSVIKKPTYWERIRLYRECDDLLEGATWTEDEARLWMKADDLDKNIYNTGMKPELYNVDAVGYESIMLGMFQILYGADNPSCESTGIPKITELIPMYSRDGYHFSRPSRQSILSASVNEDKWDRGYIQSVGGVTVINGDELWIYYTGFRGDRTVTGGKWYQNGMYKNGSTGIAKLRRDGFVSLNGKGKLTTHKLTVSGKETLHINADGKVRVKILNENDEPIAVSNRFDGDSTDNLLKFENFDVRSLNNKIFRLEFCVDGKLYSFGFADKTGDFNGAHAAGIVKH